MIGCESCEGQVGVRHSSAGLPQSSSNVLNTAEVFRWRYTPQCRGHCGGEDLEETTKRQLSHRVGLRPASNTQHRRTLRHLNCYEEVNTALSVEGMRCKMTRTES